MVNVICLKCDPLKKVDRRAPAFLQSQCGNMILFHALKLHFSIKIELNREHFRAIIFHNEKGIVAGVGIEIS